MCLRILFIISSYLGINAVPPEACFANFKWEDCGGTPTKVLYYWKPGSRCEVGVWRGCLPNLNMFKDEYECVETCIFRTRAEARDYHSLGEVEQNVTVSENDTTVTQTPDGNGTAGTGDENPSTESQGEENKTDSSNQTNQDQEATTASDANESQTTIAATTVAET